MFKQILAPIFALFIAAAAGGAHAADIVPNAQAGAGKVAMCIGCHGIKGYQATFPEVYKVPMISGQNAKYIAAALNAYKNGDRRHPSMRGIALSLTEQDIADISAYYEQNRVRKATGPATPPAPPAVVQSLLTKGNCISCHGANFSTPSDPSYPKLAGQHADYLYAAIRAYQAVNNNVFGRNHAIMGPQTKPFTHKELKALTNYISSIPGELETVPQKKFR